MKSLNKIFHNYRYPRFQDYIFIIVIIPLKVLRSRTPQMVQHRADEIKNLIKLTTFKVLLNEKFPEDANILPGRFVLTIKSTIYGSITHKERFVISRHHDGRKQCMVIRSQTLCNHHNFTFSRLLHQSMDFKYGIRMSPKHA